jgi:hypothetical protein
VINIIMGFRDTGCYNRVPKAKAETRTEVETSSWQSPNQTVWFPKPNHLVSPNLGQKKASRITDGSSTLMVSSRPHTQPEEEDIADEGAEDEGRSDREAEK